MKRHFLIIIILLLNLAIVSCSSVVKPAQPKEPGIVAMDFTVALAESREANLKDLVRQEEQTLINDWLQSHDEYRCKAPFWAIDDQRVEVYRNPNPDFKLDNGKLSFDTLYFCRTKNDVYILRVKDIVLSSLGSGWIIEGWGDVCETHEYEGCR
jgi:hypothetical protein